MALNTLNTNGYRVKNRDKLDKKYICPICDNVLKDPVQLECGHRICQPCIQPTNDLVICSECKSKTITSIIRLDKGFQRDMKSLIVMCISDGCDWSGQLGKYQNHLEEKHKEYKCEYCNEIFRSQSLLEDHKSKSCLKIPMDCDLQRYGCKEQFLRGDREKHYQSENHQVALLVWYDQISKQFTELPYTLATSESTMEIETSDVIPKLTTAATTSAATEKFIDDLSNLHDTVGVLSNGVHLLSDELRSINSESEQQSQSLETTDKTLTTIKSSIEESNNLLTAMNTNVQILQQDLSILKQKCEDQQVSSYDGVLVWKITQFQDKMTDAKSERQVSIYSPPFRSSTTGYKMRARLYPYGDGNARRTHMSLFFVIMRGPHDSILQFPFNYKVTFCLYDQTPQQNHIIDSFRPDTKSNSFQRPRSDMNIASGIPKFVPLSTVEKPDNPYVKDDTMFIKVFVDFENMPKTILSYALSLNPGLPILAQQKLIKQEMERRSQQTQPTAQAPITVGVSETKKK